jgi:hypothetical protein
VQFDTVPKWGYVVIVSRRHIVLKIMDITVVFLLWGAVMGLSVLSLVRMVRGRNVAYYGQAALLPESWRRWVCGEKPKKQGTGK